ncbi:YtxH domain-containing protein [Mariniflexile sp. AS56]|uniref:YtxH domain-containing protein n=1 Tax=Mariniflexile sp. AS56 TaxID=3063957 RepID=UPI0026F19B07|nr:YtxH domain-containing protein [Mariniflexile sp. AS56]MDO7172342.1 YtxH domain-containing protein [Mariniflexile sp. AS56]
MKTSKSIIGVIGGVAVGAALGVLFAPDKGTETRKKIAKKTSDVKNKAKNGLNDVLDTVSEKYNSVVTKGEDLAEQGKEEIKTVREQMNK